MNNAKVIERSKLIGILINRWDNKVSREEFIVVEGYVDDEKITDFLVETRENEKYPFGLRLDDIEEGSLFTVTTETIPGQIITTVDVINDISKYTEILQNTEIINKIYASNNYLFAMEIVSNLHKRIQILRDRKINEIIK